MTQKKKSPKLAYTPTMQPREQNPFFFALNQKYKLEVEIWYQPFLIQILCGN